MKEINQFKKKFDKISLTKEEKASGRDAFMQFMQANPLPTQAPHSLTKHFFSRFLALSRRPLATTFATLTVFVLFGTGVSYAAQDSMPGELLYPVKIHVNEKVEGFFNFSPKSKAEWELDRMNRRLEEVENLKEKGPLDLKTKFEIKQQLDLNAEVFENHLEDLRSEGDEEGELEIRNQFQNVFQNHQDEALDIEFNIKDKPFPPIKDLIENQTETETESETEETTSEESSAPESTAEAPVVDTTLDATVESTIQLPKE